MPVGIGLVTLGYGSRGSDPFDGGWYRINGGCMKGYTISDKPLCAGDGEAKGWSTAGFLAILGSPIRQGEQMSVIVDEALFSVVTVSLDLAYGGREDLLPKNAQSGSDGKDLGHISSGSSPNGLHWVLPIP